jgi:hypothetical protein
LLWPPALCPSFFLFSGRNLIFIRFFAISLALGEPLRQFEWKKKICANWLTGFPQAPL